MKIKITNSEPKLISFWDIYGKELDVKNTKTVNFASGPKNYYVVEFEGREYEVPEDMVDNSIPNNYEGKTPEEVWNAWTEDQREHFLADHNDDWFSYNEKNGENLEIWSNLYNKPFSSLPKEAVHILAHHIGGGQYGKGGEVEGDEFQEAAEFLMDKTVFSYSLGQLEPTEHKIKGVHITPKHFNQRHLYFSFYGNEWPHNFNDYDRLTSDQLGDFIAGEQVELKDSQGEPYIVALGDIAGKGKNVDAIKVGDEVEFITPTESEKGITYNVLELRGDRVLVNDNLNKDWEIRPTYVYLIKDLKKVDTAAKGTKINEMENKNYYYLKPGNIVQEMLASGQIAYVYEIIGHDKYGVKFKQHSVTKSKPSIEFDVPFNILTTYFEDKHYIVPGMPFENNRDKALLEMEIADIKNSFKIEEEKAEVRKKEKEVAQAKHEADVLLKKAVETETAAKDTIDAMALLTVKKNTEDAYMRDTYGNKAWEIAIKELGKLGFSKDQIEWILNSKYMRWASDEYRSPNGRLKGTEIIQFYHSHGFMDDDDKQIVPANAKAGKGKKVGGEKYLNKWYGGYKYNVFKKGTKYYIDPEFLTEVTKRQDYKDVVYFDTPQEAVNYAETVIDSRAANGKMVGELATLTEEENKVWQTAFEYYLNEGKSDSQADKLAWKDIQAEFPRLKDFSGIKEDNATVQEDFYQAKKSKTQKGKWALLKNGEVIQDDLDEDTAGTIANERNAEIEYAKIDSKKAKAENPKASKGAKLFKKEAKIGKYYHFSLNNPKGVKKCAVPSWASDLAGSVYEGAKITTCQKDGEWFAQNVMIPTKNISKLQARSYAQQIALKIKK